MQKIEQEIGLDVRKKLEQTTHDHPFYLDVAPLRNMAINFGSRTLAHRDRWDEHRICCVVPLTDFTGGSIALYQPKLVLDIPHGSALIFDSTEIVHFNEDFEGERICLILFSQGDHGRTQAHNGWDSSFIHQPTDSALYETDTIASLG